MAILQVNSAMLRNKAEQLKQLNSNFKTACGGLDTQWRSLSNMWTGDAKTVFQNCYDRNQNEFTKFYNGINEYVNALLDAATRYEEMERRNADIAKCR